MSFRNLLLASGAALMALPAHAQTAESGAEQDEIIVTGSRIPQNPNLISTTPVQALDDEAIRLAGEISLSEIVNDIPALVSSLTVEQSVSGGSAANLRGLGAERTLTLVNGRRHVGGFRGTSAVDLGSIPEILVERVEVTTGGASAIYGADAVTGVVNFILREDFEGFEVDGRAGVSTQGDAENFSIEALYGVNFGKQDRGNLVIAGNYSDDSLLFNGDRDFTRDNISAGLLANPLLRLQAGDLGPDTPNFNGLRIGTLLSGIDTTGLTLTATEQALLARIVGAPARVVVPDPRVWLSSQSGSIAPGFGGRDQIYVDLNNNGIADCQESRGGQVGFLAGCWTTDANGNAIVFQEGLIADTSFRGAGLAPGEGSAGAFAFNGDTLFPETDRYAINANLTYELAPGLKAYGEAKYVNSESTTFAEQDTFFDTLFIAPDNPFIPEALLPVVAETGGLLLTQDPTGYITNNDATITERETTRFVGGLRWETGDHFWDFSVNHGRFKNTQTASEVYLDRQFAATDAVRAPNGDIVCRSDLDPDASYEIDYFTAGNGFADGNFSSNRYYSFTPGDGSCQPLNPFGTNAVSQAAQDFLNARVTDVIDINQTVISASVAGTFGVLDTFLDGDVGYALGAEYRREASESRLDPLRLGILPSTTSLTPGVLVNTIDPFLNSFISIDNDQQFNTQGSFNVRDVYAELRLPIFVDAPFAEELTVDGAVRYADYSTSGGQTTWKVGANWSPVEDIGFRGTYSEAVRAPNISELFDPALPITIGSNQDPCDPDNIGLGSSVRQANCVAALTAAGVPQDQILDGDGNYIFENPLTGRFSGTSGGNIDLTEEQAETFTVGAVFTPSFLPGFDLTVDYWDITISNAISAVAAGDILDGCFDSADFPNVPFCGQFERRSDGGLSDLTSGQINFAQLEAAGVDVAAGYSFDVGENAFGIRMVGTWQERLNQFFNPLDLTEVDPEIREISRPEYVGNVTLSWSRDRYGLNFQTNYQSAVAVAELEDILDGQFGDFGFFDESFVFDVNGTFELNERLSLYAGVNNLGDEEPYITQSAFPVGPRGRFVFAGFTFKG